MPKDEDHDTVRVLDLQFGGAGTIASFLLASAVGPVLVETGPDSTYPALVRALREAGTRPEAVRHVLLTHIHLDHGGAAWRLAAPGAMVYVHPVGAPHLAEPSKLFASAKKIYGDQMDSLWGRLEPIPVQRLRVVEDGEVLRIGDLAIEALHTPGHASHHVAYRLGGVLFTGDVGGVRIGAGPVVPPCPPPAEPTNRPTSRCGSSSSSIRWAPASHTARPSTGWRRHLDNSRIPTQFPRREPTRGARSHLPRATWRQA
jgi:glyoxylase-like metal-dependent hydrolase (beta-lactamase superfamily II)